MAHVQDDKDKRHAQARTANAGAREVDSEEDVQPIRATRTAPPPRLLQPAPSPARATQRPG
eukprot:1372126-Prymnesium_polylepis.1